MTRVGSALFPLSEPWHLFQFPPHSSPTRAVGGTHPPHPSFPSPGQPPVRRPQWASRSCPRASRASVTHQASPGAAPDPCSPGTAHSSQAHTLPTCSWRGPRSPRLRPTRAAQGLPKESGPGSGHMAAQRGAGRAGQKAKPALTVAGVRGQHGLRQLCPCGCGAAVLGLGLGARVVPPHPPGTSTHTPTNMRNHRFPRQTAQTRKPAPRSWRKCGPRGGWTASSRARASLGGQAATCKLTAEGKRAEACWHSPMGTWALAHV